MEVRAMEYRPVAPNLPEYHANIPELSPSRSQGSSTGGNSSLGDYAPRIYTPPTPPTPHEDEKIFSSKAELQLHTQIHLREAKPYKCNQCSKTFANSSYLSQHTRIHLGIKPYRCEICQRKFTQLSHLQQHIRTHTGDKPYKCRHQGCIKAFSQLSNLQSHSRCHQTDKPYKCNSCYKCFIDEPSLLEHIPKHKESKHLKTHICQYCGKSYTQETYLAKHMQKHAERTDKRPPILGPSLRPSMHSITTLPDTVAAAISHHHSVGSNHYWHKVSPDSVISEVHERLAPPIPAPPALHDLHHSASEERDTYGSGSLNQEQGAAEIMLPPLSVSSSIQQQNSGSQLQRNRSPLENDTGQHASQTHHHNSSSAFTPISSISINSLSSTQHSLNSLNHLHYPTSHHSTSRPYLYETINSQKISSNSGTLVTSLGTAATAATSAVGAANQSSAFPNQLISLHQIRNYAHQPNLNSLGSLGNFSNLSNLGSLSHLNTSMNSNATLNSLKDKQ